MELFHLFFITVIFANFAESIAEGRGKAQADSLKNQKETSANLLKEDNSIEKVDGCSLKKEILLL